MSTASYRRRRAERLAAGRCPDCGGEREDPAYRACAACRAGNAAANRERRAALAEARLCADCGEALPGRLRTSRCGPCLRRLADRAARIRAARLAEDRCPTCAGPRHRSVDCPTLQRYRGRRRILGLHRTAAAGIHAIARARAVSVTDALELLLADDDALARAVEAIHARHPKEPRG